MASNTTVRPTRTRPRATTDPAGASLPTPQRGDVRPDDTVGVFCWD
jgi:hypothetical protein